MCAYRLHPPLLALTLLFLASFVVPSVSQTTFHLDGTPNSYLQFPSWQYFFSKTAKTTHRSIHEASLSFEFKCPLDQQNSSPLGGLLLYADDQTGIGGIFLEVKLLSETNLRVRIDDSGAVRTRNIIELRQEINFTDGQWHRLELIRHFQPSAANQDYVGGTVDSEDIVETITLKVDSEVIHKKIELSPASSATPPPGAIAEASEHNQHKSKSLFVGGLPLEYQHRYLAHLALPTAAYELHFRGAVRNVLYAAASADQQDQVTDLRMQQPVEKSGLLSEDSDRFLTEADQSECHIHHNRCQHGGHCYNTQSGVYCDCSSTDYEGPNCQRERHMLEATFRGSLGEYLGYNHEELPNSWSFISTSESFELSFRTKLANGLLLFTGDDYEDYLVIAIRDAGLSLTMKMGSVLHEKTVKPSKVRFDDNQWHTVQVSRKIREISPSTYFCHFSLTVDGIYTQHGSAAGTIPYFVSKVFYVGGIVHNSATAAPVVEESADQKLTASSNFMGCLRKIVYVADTVRLDLLALVNAHNRFSHRLDGHRAANHTSNLIRFFGHENQASHGYHQTPTFSSMTCQDVDASDPITFTTADSYLKLSEGWNSPKEGTLSLKIRTNEPNGVLLYSVGVAKERNSSLHDYFALELLDGQLYLLQHLGSSPVKVKASEKRIDDSHWHTVTVRRSGRSGQVVVDEAVSDFVSPGSSNHLDLIDLYLGGFPRFTGDKLTYTPPQLWSASFGYGYIGCVRDLFLNDRIVDIAALAKRQDSGSVKPSCHSSASQCNNQPCQNGGTCSEGWNRFECQCSHTAFTGSVCAKNAATLSFNGDQYLTINLPEELHTQAESLYIRFRTKKPKGLLLTTSHSMATQSLTLFLESGSVRIDLNYGEGHMNQIAKVGAGLNDDKWHTVHIERRGHNLEIELDQKHKKVVELTGQHYTLRVSSIHVGALIKSHKVAHAKHYPGFEGYMQNFVFNGQSYFEKTRDGQLSSGSIRMTAKLGKKDRILHNVVTFKSKYTFVGLPQLKAYTRLNIYFQFKTREANGLIFFNGGGQRHDFIAVELVNGHLHYVFDLGDGPRRLQSKSRVTLNDNRWHTVTLGRPSLHQHTMLLDDLLMTTSTASSADRNQHLDLNGLLYFGGVRDNMWSSLPKAIKSKHGFEGCIASLDFNGENFNLVASEVLIPSTLVEAGCSAPITRCSSTACANRGICVQLWNSYTCDCDLTTFQGPTCADGNESTAYQFGPNPGLVTFSFDESNRPDTRNDLLALGFLTSQKNGVLVRIDSGTTADYLQLELIDGNVLVVYNLGTEDIDIGELGIKVNDGKYHIVRLTRSGQNSTLQIDNHNVLTRSPTGKQMNIFNTHAKIEIGGHKNVLRSSIEKPFVGIIAGLVFNGHRLLDMAAEDDPRVKIEGDVDLMLNIGKQDSVLTTPTIDRLGNQMLSEPKSPSYGNDELIYSGQGSGCFDVNDDEECAHLTNNEGSGDDSIITPVYAVVSRLRPTSSPVNNRNRPNVWRKQCANDDDDECVEGSGAYEPEPPASNHSLYDNYYSSTVRSFTTWLPPTVAPMNRPPISGAGVPPYFNTPPPYYTYGGNQYGNEYVNPEQLYPMRPKTTAPSWTKPVYSVSGPTRPIVLNQPVGPQDPPEIYDVPLNIPAVVNDTAPSQVTEPILKSTNDRTVMIIGMIAICLIVVVIIAPIVLFFKVRLQANDAAFKVETFGGPKFGSTMPIQGGGYPQFAPVVRATSVSGIPGHPGLGGSGGMMPPNAMSTLGRMSRAGTRPGTPTDMMKKKDPHEWYV